MNQGQKGLRVLLTGGGTGGHLFPGIAAAEALCERVPGTEVMFIGTHRKMDQTSLSKHGFRVRCIHSYGIKGKSFLQLFKALMVLPLSFCEALFHILTFRPHIVVGVGGYVTGAVIGAARLVGRKTVIHEQNSIPGLANRKLGRFACKICLSLPGSEKYFPGNKTILTGNPVRKALVKLGRKEKTGDGQALTILILGGSQGASGVNRLVVEAITQHRKKLSQEFTLIHQTGVADVDMVRKKYEEAGVKAEVASFFHDMKEVYRKADLVISRAGATTLAELAVLGKPVILVPFPYAADNHQEKNGSYYVDGGGGLMFAESELTGKRLAETVEQLLASEETLIKMGQCMNALSFPQAAEKIVDVCLQEIAGQR